MSQNLSTAIEKPVFHPALLDNEDEIYYPDTDETIMPEGMIHFLLSVRLVSTLLVYFAERKNVEIFGNVMFYYEKGNTKKVVSPDVMICFGLETMPKRVYKLWETNVVPAVVIEFASKSTWFKDVSEKIALYQKLGVAEYYVFDPEYDCLPKPLIAFRLIDGVFVEQKITDSRIFSDALGLELVDTGETLRVFDPQTKETLLTAEELATENKRLKLELAQLKQQN